MEQDQVNKLFEALDLNTESKRQEMIRLGSHGPLQLQPEQPANFKLDSMTLGDNEDACAELA